MGDLILSVAIQTHPARAGLAERLRLELERQRVAGVAPIDVCSDLDQDGPWGSARRAWRRARAHGARAHLVIQDDAVPCVDFLEAAAHLVALVGPVSFFCESPGVEQVAARGDRWYRRRFLYGQALALPLELAAGLVDWVEAAAPRAGWHHDDVRISAYLSAHGVQPACTVPSLVDHGDAPSLLRHPVVRARRFIGRDARAMDLDWTRGLP